MSSNEESPQLVSLSEIQRNEALKRFQIIQPFVEDLVPLPNIAVTSGLGLRTLRRWANDYKCNGLIGLVRQARNDKGNRNLPDDVVFLVEAAALKKPPLSVANVHRLVTEICIKQGWKVPSYSQVYSIVSNLEPGLVMLAHEGSKAYDEAFDLIFRREAARPNEMWQADHTPLDIQILGSGGKAYRPWLTAILDDYSRAVPGYFLGIEPPSALRTALALRQAIWRKSEPHWHLQGIPDSFYTDHGSDFTSNHMEQVSADLKVQLYFSNVGCPRGRGKIERLFGSINELFLSRLPGYISPGVDSWPDPVMTLAELEQAFRKWLVDDYLQRIHSETKMAPQLRWEESGFIPRMPISLEQLDLLLLTVAKPRKVHKDGIYFSGLRFMDTTLAGYVGESVVIRYDPRDMAEIRIFHDGKFLCRAVSGEIANQTVTLKSIIEARRQRKKELRGTLREHSEFIGKFLEVHHPKPISIETSSTAENIESSPRLKRYKDD